MMNSPRVLYYNALTAFKQVSQSVLSTQLNPDWREHLHALRAALFTLNSSQGMPITPKAPCVCSARGAVDRQEW